MLAEMYGDADKMFVAAVTGTISRGPQSHPCTALYISLVILYRNIQEHDDDCTAHG